MEQSFPDFELYEVRYDALVVEGELSLESFLRETYPAPRFTQNIFPAPF